MEVMGGVMADHKIRMSVLERILKLFGLAILFFKFIFYLFGCTGS